MRDGDFYLGENAVGHFVETDGPLSSGRHRYEPYRGTGHLELSHALESGERPRCWTYRDGSRVWFTVTAEEFEAKSPKSDWWISIEEVETQPDDRRQLTSQQLGALIVDALADARLIAKSKVPTAITIAAEEIEVRKAMGDY